jgi:hypothetical protein
LTRLLPLLALVFGLGCGAAPLRRGGADPAAVLDAARQRAVPYALQARFSVTIQGPDLTASTTGGLIVHRPDRFRIDVLTPLSTPLLLVASDGRALHAFLSGERVFYRGDDAARVLGELTGGAFGLADLVAVFTGTLPLAGAEVVALTERAAGGAVVELAAAPLPGGDRVGLRAELDADAVVRAVQVSRVAPGADPVSVIEVDTRDVTRVGRSRVPEELQVRLPTLGWTLDLAFSSWDELGQIPDVFALGPPAGATQADLVQTLRELAERRRAGGGG